MVENRKNKVQGDLIEGTKPYYPTKSEAAGLTVGGSLAIIIAWLLKSKGIHVPAEVNVAIGSVMAQLVHYVTSFLPPRRF